MTWDLNNILIYLIENITKHSDLYSHKYNINKMLKPLPRDCHSIYLQLLSCNHPLDCPSSLKFFSQVYVGFYSIEERVISTFLNGLIINVWPPDSAYSVFFPLINNYGLAILPLQQNSIQSRHLQYSRTQKELPRDSITQNRII